MKIVKTKRVNIAVCWNGLRNTTPKQFPTIAEMEKTGTILETFEEAIPEFVEMIKEGETLNKDIQTGKIKPEEIAEKKTEYGKKSNMTEGKMGDQEVSIEFENDEFNTFFQQFERWGKDWFAKLDAFLAFRKDINNANKQPKK